MTPNIIIQREAELTKRWNHPVHRDLVPFMKEDFESFHRESMLALLQSEIEWLEGEMFVDPNQAGQFAMHTDGHNNALEDVVSHLQEQIALIKKL